MAIFQETILQKPTTTIDDVIYNLTQIKNKYGNINVVLQYQDDGGAYPGHTPGIYAFYVENEDGETPVVVME